MNLEHGTKQARESFQQHHETHTQLHGRRLVFARVTWLTLVIPSLGLFILANLLYATRLINPDQAVRARMLSPLLPASGYIVSFSHLYFQFGSSLPLIVILASLSSLVWIGVGLLLFWRKSDDRMGLLATFALIMFGLAGSPQLYLMNVFSEMSAPWKWPIIFVDILGWASFGLALLLFPDGRFVPRWMRWVFLAALVFCVCWGLPSDSFFSTVQWPRPLFWLSNSLLCAPIFVQLYRYWHPSSVIERQQTRVVVFAVVISMLAVVVLSSSPLRAALAQLGLTGSAYVFLSTGLYAVVLYLFPLAIGVAVLRYRLWDIDILINRTLVYGTLTLLLVAVYAGSVIGIQALLRGLISQDNNVAIVVSTLVIAALFTPLRRVIQRLIDRRFHRQKYDAERTLAAFSATLRNEVDLDQLRADLVAVIKETMQPTFVSVWVRSPERDENQRISWKANPPGPGFRESEKIHG